MKNQISFAKLFGLIFFGIGMIFLILGIIFLFSGFNNQQNTDIKTAAIVFLGIGGIFVLTGIISFLISYKQKRKMNRLMSEGVCYEADIVRVYYNFNMRMNRSHPLVVECGYRNNDGKTYLVKSRNLWLNRLFINESDIRSKVWVDADNPKDYFVEVFFDADKYDQNTKYDYDFR